MFAFVITDLLLLVRQAITAKRTHIEQNEGMSISNKLGEGSRLQAGDTNLFFKEKVHNCSFPICNRSISACANRSTVSCIVSPIWAAMIFNFLRVCGWTLITGFALCSFMVCIICFCIPIVKSLYAPCQVPKMRSQQTHLRMFHHIFNNCNLLLNTHSQQERRNDGL